jgi:putative membrane protein
MWRIGMWGLALAAGWIMSSGLGWSADAPLTSVVLGKVHRSNLKEISRGELAQKNGRSLEMKDFGRTLVDEHTAVDKRVVGLARADLVDLPSHTLPFSHGETAEIPVDADFDTALAKLIFDDCEEELTEEAAARDATGDETLRAFLDEIIPTLRKQRDVARRIADEGGPRASL